MRLVRLLPTLALSLALCGSALAVDAVTVDANGKVGVGKTPESANAAVLQVNGQATADNLLQGTSGIAIHEVASFTLASFGAWHWIDGTQNTAIQLPTAVGNAGKTFGLRVLGAAAAPMTYTVNALASPQEYIDGMASVALTANTTLVLMSDGTGWARVSGTPTSSTPSGFISASASRIIPSGWLECNGQAVSRTTYAALFAAICPADSVTGVDINTETLTTNGNTNCETGTPIRVFSSGTLPAGLSVGTLYYSMKTGANTIKVATTVYNAIAGNVVNLTNAGSGTMTVQTFPFGQGDGSTSFNLPNATRRALVGYGGTATSYLPACLGATGGAETHTLSIGEMPAHAHGFSTGAAAGGTRLESGYAGNGPVGTTGTVGFGSPHNNLPPSLAVCYLIKY